MEEGLGKGVNEEKEKHFVCNGETSSSVKVRQVGGQNRPAL